jgi:DUF3099 family protein
MSRLRTSSRASRRASSKPEVHVVTGARPSRFDDIADRQRRYLTKMAIRTVCVLVAFFAPIPWWARGVAVAAAVVLPWMSVTAANSPNRGVDDETEMRSPRELQSRQD